jgi:SHS2 domain-containing protein
VPSSVILKLTVYGDSYSELVEKAETSLISFLDIEPEELDNKVQFDLTVTENLDEDVMHSYVGQFIAKIR